MPAPPACSRCGRPLPDSPSGECPACLLELSLHPNPADRVDLSPAEVQPHFPQLEVLSVVGRGGAGVVYKARHKTLHRLVAVKLLAADRAANATFADRLLREARALARLNHPNIVTVYEVGHAAGSVFLMMEFVEGPTVRERLRAGPLPPAEAFRVIPQICAAMQYAHDHGVIHRDIKPDNVLLAADGRVKVADFGLAKVADADESHLTGPADRMGTARYMAPEQWADTAGVDHRADLYSIGVMFYEMLTGTVPAAQFDPPSAKAGTDPRLDGVVSRSLRTEPAERYQSADEFKQDVERVAACRPRRWRWPVATALVAAAAAVTVAVRLPAGGSGRPADPPMPPPVEVLTSADWVWTPPENLGPGVNTSDRELTPFVTADGLTLLFASDRPGGQGDTDLWQARRSAVGEPFGEPTNLGPTVNGPGGEDAPCLSADGLTLVFSGKRDGRSDTDLWLCRRASVDAAWDEPRPPGPDVNSPFYEFRPWLSADGLRLTFTGIRPRGEITFVCTRPTTADPFGPPARYGFDPARPVVTGLSFSADGRVLMGNRSNRQFPGNLLWLSRVEEDDPFRNLVSFGPVVNAAAVDMSPAPSADGTAVYFQSDRPGGAGGFDLWVTRRVPRGR